MTRKWMTAAVVAAAWMVSACGGGSDGRFEYANALDSAFGSGGVVRQGTGVSAKAYVDNFSAAGLDLDSSGRIVTVGRRQSSEVTGIWLQRFSSTGSLDERCGTGGWVSHYDADPFVPRFVRAMPDGRYAVAGLLPYSSIVMFRSDCTVDTSFGTNGVASTERFFASPIVGMDVGTDGRLTVVMDATTAGSKIAVARFLPSGQLDTSFGEGQGSVMLDEPDRGGVVTTALAVRPNGKIVLGATFDYGLQAGVWTGMIQLLPDGRLDTSFGTRGAYSVRISGKMRAASGPMVLLPDGSAILAGYVNETLFGDLLIGADSFWLKVDSNGRPVNGFGDQGNGQLVWNAGPAGHKSGNFMALMSLAPDGSLVDCQNWTNNTSTVVGLNFVQQAIVTRRSAATGAVLAGPGTVKMEDDRPAFCRGMSFDRDGRPHVVVDHNSITGYTIARVKL